MRGFKIVLFLFGLFLCANSFSHREQPSCVTIIKQCGVRAIVHHPECAAKLLPEEFLQNQNNTLNCHLGTSTLQGHKENFKDQVFCNLDMHISFRVGYQYRDVKVGLVTVFDYQVGKEASTMIAKLLRDYFLAHTYFLRGVTMYFVKSGIRKEDMKDHGLVYEIRTFGSTRWTLLRKINDATQLEIMKEALRRAIHDIGLTFFELASTDLHDSKCVATVAFMVDGQILFANGCKSRALLCDEDSWIDPSAMNLARVRRSNINDERAQYKAAVNYARPQSFRKRSGVISAAPVVTNWQPLPSDKTYMVVASDVVLESLTPSDVCALLRRRTLQKSNELTMVTAAHCPIFDPLTTHADCIVDNAYLYGSSSNLLAVQLKSAGFVQPKES